MNKMEEIKQKVHDLELALNYVCYDADVILKLQPVWDKLELLQEVVSKKLNEPAVSDSVELVREGTVCNHNYPKQFYSSSKKWECMNCDEIIKQTGR